MPVPGSFLLQVSVDSLGKAAKRAPHIEIVSCRKRESPQFPYRDGVLLLKSHDEDVAPLLHALIVELLVQRRQRL